MLNDILLSLSLSLIESNESNESNPGAGRHVSRLLRE